ncbi:MAG: lysylphosphatidylglycerol synthase transmembrane domain-containing protein [Vicinamibacteria bacterium]
MSLKARLASRKLHSVLFLAVALLLLGMFFRGSDFSEIRDSFLRARPSLILAALIATMGTYFIRALRWQGLLSPLGHAGLVNCFSTTVIGFMMNFLAGRLGEIARPYLLARREGFSASGAFATILVERVLDLVTVVFFVAFWLIARPPRAAGEDVMSSLELGGAIGLALAVVTFASMYFFARYPERSMVIARRFTRLLPQWLEAKAVSFLQMFRSGLGVLVDRAGLARAGVLSVALWLAVCLAFWFTARAFGVRFHFGDTFLVIGFLTVGVAVPTPGAIGGYHYMAALALTTLFGTGASLAAAVALAAHAISFLPVTILGILLFAKAGLSVSEIK